MSNIIDFATREARRSTPNRIELADVLKFVIASRPGKTDGELAQFIYGYPLPRARINVTCRKLRRQGFLVRREADGAIENHPGRRLGAFHSHRSGYVTAVYER
jgi:hypothetical protein